MDVKATLGIFDDHPLTGKGIADFLKHEPGISILFVKHTKAELMEQLQSQAPHVLMLDVLAPDTRGLELFEVVSKKYPRVKMIAHTSLSSTILVESLLTLGVKAYVNKKQKPEDIVTAIREVLDDGIYLPADFQFLLKKPRDPYSALSAREVEVLHYIAREYTSIKIAEELNLSVNTVESHRKNIFTKLKVNNVAGMVREAGRLGYLPE